MKETALKEFRRINDEVYYASSPLSAVTRGTIEELKAVAVKNPRRRARICFHASPEAPLHDMLIVLCSTTGNQPHMHLNKAEAFHVIEGRLKVVLFSDAGAIEESIELGDLSTAGAAFYCRIPVRKFHTVIPLTDTVVFREVTDGPFIPEETVFASWSLPDVLP
jgi:cupin fold WbuC family metalloprotein